MKFILSILLLLIGCDESNSIVSPYSDSTLEIFSTTYQDDYGFYHYQYTGEEYYGSIYFQTEPLMLVNWTSPNEFCIQHFNELICENVISGQTYSDENGSGQQNFYMNETFIGDTLTLIGFLSNEYTPIGNVQDEIKLIIGETE